jgi:6-phosphogluconolactonase/glucosamine-6-phosphate isomerase/deaminase
MAMPIVVVDDAAAAARAAGAVVAWEVRRVVGERGHATLALSGGSSPAPMFAELARLGLPWEAVDIVQVDERVAPAGDPARNLGAQQAELSPEARLHPMPVEDGDPSAYAPLIHQLDVVHLGLGDDGHTASLVPGDPVLAVRDADVALTSEYRGHRRMTVTYPVLDRAGAIVWLVIGEGKAAVLPRLLAADPTIPAGRVRQDRALVIADAPAASALT